MPSDAEPSRTSCGSVVLFSSGRRFASFLPGDSSRWYLGCHSGACSTILGRHCIRKRANTLAKFLARAADVRCLGSTRVVRGALRCLLLNQRGIGALGWRGTSRKGHLALPARWPNPEHTDCIASPAFVALLGKLRCPLPRAWLHECPALQCPKHDEDLAFSASSGNASPRPRASKRTCTAD